MGARACESVRKKEIRKERENKEREGVNFSVSICPCSCQPEWTCMCMCTIGVKDERLPVDISIRRLQQVWEELAQEIPGQRWVPRAPGHVAKLDTSCLQL